MSCLLAALGLAVPGVLGLSAAGSGALTRTSTVDGVPMLEISPTATRVTRRPGVVIAHGFSGSAMVMRGFADTLAARGYVVVLPDFAGHGRSTRRLRVADGVAAAGSVQRDLDVAVRHLRGLPAVDPTRLALVGHSMGADAVVAYAAGHPEIGATVAISLTSTDDVPTDPARPRNLLLVVGGLEFPAFRHVALAALDRSGPDRSFDTTVGDPATGTARRAVSVSYVDHVAVLFATRTHAETVAWLDRALSVPPEGAPSGAPAGPRDRLAPATLLLLAFLVGFVPLAAAMLPGHVAGTGGRPSGWIRPRYAYGGLATALGLAAVGARALPPYLVPLAVGTYAAGFFAIAGLFMIVSFALARREAGPGVRGAHFRPRHLGPLLLLVLYAATAVAVPMHLGLTHAVPVGARWWLLPVVVGCAAVLLLGVELLASHIWWRRPLALAATAAALLLATVVGLAPGYVLLVLPLLVALFAWHAAWATWLNRLSAPAWLSALVGAVVVGWPIAMTLPLAG